MTKRIGRQSIHDWDLIFAFAKEQGLSPKQTAEHFGVSLTALYNQLSIRRVRLADGRARRQNLDAVPKSPGGVQARVARQQSEAAKQGWLRRGVSRAPDLPGEIWKPCPTWPGYEASTHGRIRSQYTVLSCKAIQNGYPTCSPSVDGRQRSVLVHRMVADAFLGPCPSGQEVRHLDGDRMNRRPENLAYGDRAANQNDRVAHGTSNHGERNVNAKLTAEQALEVYRRAMSGERHGPIAKDFGLSPPQVSAIKSGRSWSHVTGAERIVNTGRIHRRRLRSAT